MDLRNLIKWSVVLAAILAWKNMDAMDLPDDVYRDGIAATTEMPNHRAYRQLVKQMQQAVDAGHRDDALAEVAARMDYGPARSEIFLDYMLTAHESLTIANQRITDRMLCDTTTARDSDVFAVMDTIDDIKETHSREHLRHAEMTVGHASARLGDWLGQIKGENDLRQYDHAAVYRELDMKVDTVVSAACNHLAGFYDQ